MNIIIAYCSTQCNDAPENLEFGSSAYKLLIPWLAVYTEKSPRWLLITPSGIISNHLGYILSIH